MAVIYELRGGAAAYGELGVNLYSGCAVGCRYCCDAVFHRMTWERWTTGAEPRKDILSKLSREAMKMEGDSRNHSLPHGRPLSIGGGGPPNAKCPAHPRAIPPARSDRDAVRQAERRGFRHFGAQSLEIRNADSLSVGTPARGVGARRCADRRADRSAPRSPCGGNLYLGEAQSRRLSGRVDQRGRVATRRRGRVEGRQAASRRIAAERRSTAGHAALSTPTPLWPIFAAWSREAWPIPCTLRTI